MKSIYVISMIAVINANHNMEHELEQLGKLYDAVVDVVELKYGQNCPTAIDNLMDLLCDGFQYCTSDGNCMDKIKYQETLTQACGSYQEADYSIEINPNHYSNQYALTYTSLECEWTFLTTDGCTETEIEQNKIYYNDEGLIRNFYAELISEHRDCPQSGYDSVPKPTIEYPQETVYQDGYRREYSNVQIAGGDPARLLFNQVTNPTELGYIEADLDKLQDQIAEIASTDFVGMSLSEAHSKDISEGIIRYICLVALEGVGPEDGIVLNVWIQYDVTKLAKNNIVSGYDSDPEPTMVYSQETTALTVEECQDNADGINEFIDTFSAILDDCDSDEYNDNVDHLMGLLSDDFANYDINDGKVVATQNKERYIQDALQACREFKEVDYTVLSISCSNATIEWEITFLDNGCTMTMQNELEFVFNPQGFISRIDSRAIEETSSTICPQTTPGYQSEPVKSDGYVEDKPSSTTDDCPNNSDGINEFFETLSSIVGHCSDNMDDLMDLLSDDFTEDHVQHDMVHHAVNKDEYRQEAIESCGTLTKIGYVLSPISCNSVTVELELTLNDGCIMKKTEHREFVFGYQGLITTLNYQDGDEVSVTCPQPNKYDVEPSTTSTYESEPEETDGYIENKLSTTDDCPNDSDGINKFFETLSSIVGNCNDNIMIDNVVDLLSDDFTQNHIMHDMVHHYVNKDEYRQELMEFCDVYTKVGYVLSTISCNSVTVGWELTLNDSCVIKKMEHREFTFDYQGLITALNYQEINDPSIICQQSNEYEAEPSTTASAYKSGSGFAALINRNEEDKAVPMKPDGGAPMLIKKVREKQDEE